MHGIVGRNNAPTAPQRSIARAVLDFAWLVRWWRTYLLTRQTELALDNLDDAALRDIGLSRSMIPYVAKRLSGNSVRPSEERNIPSRYY